ncbi:MAG TPA: hypothetical protein VE057_01775 [Archangium sp.]|nr:hypothetical protein [Archangium sp.]
MMAKRMTEDSRLPELLPLLEQLLAATREWARGGEPGPDTEDLRRRALLLNHARYTALIPAYRHLAEEQGLEGEAGLEALVQELMFSDGLFKSYQVEWVEQGDFTAMTDWLGSIFAREPRIDAREVRDLHAWRERLKRHEVFLTTSSGTSGRPSFVPRDRRTLDALRYNGSAYPHPVWPMGPGGLQHFACLVLGPRGRGLGLQAAGSGLARMAVRSHYLDDTELTLNAFQRPGGEGSGRPGAPEAAQDAAHERALEFLQQCTAEALPVLVFGPPFRLRQACERIAARGAPLPLTPHSIVVSGGGWKSFGGQKISQTQLLELIEVTLGIPRQRVIDTYSTAELNCVFMSCAEHRHHIPPLVEPVVLDEALTGTPGAEGQGMLGVLDPFALSYPGFILTGDQVCLTREPCACGLTGWSLVGDIERAPGQTVRGCGGALASVLA